MTIAGIGAQPISGVVIGDKTYNASSFPGLTDTAKANLAIVQAKADGVPRVYIPGNMTIDPILMNYDATVQLVREGGNWSVWDVKAYGAKGDGVSNDTYAFVGAILGAKTVQGIVYIPSNSNLAVPYLLTAAGAMTTTAILNLNGRVSLIGAGSNDGPIIKLGNGANRSLIEIGELSQGNRIEHFRIEGNKANQSGTSHGIRLRNVTPLGYQDSRYLFTNLLIQDFLTSGVLSEAAASELRMQYVIVRGCTGNGFEIAGSDTRLIECESGSNGGKGLYLTQGNNIIRGGAYFSNTSYNIHVASSATFVRISDTDLDRSQLDNIRIDASNTSVIGCLSRDPSQAADSVSSHIDVAAGLTGISIIGNKFKAKSLTNDALYLIRCNGALTNSVIGPNTREAVSADNGYLFAGALTDVVITRATGTQTFTDLDATPSVSGSGRFTTPTIFAAINSGATTITMFDDGHDGQEISVISTNANTTIQNNANMQLQGAVNFVMAANNTITLKLFSGVWREMGRKI